MLLKSFPRQKFILSFGERHDGKAALADQGGIGEELIWFDLRERNCFGERFSGFELNGGILGVGNVDRKNRSSADGRFVVAGFVNDEPRARRHLGKVS
jgi:hypothetical protein